MIRDISEIQTLATKYSKPQLARMAQMGLIDPTKAVMAGMMIDRITKSNMQAPQQTVAQEALTPMPTQGAMAPQMSPAMQQPMPQAPVAPAGIGALPTQPEPNAGVSALPSGITNMAEGGIVAFAGEGPSLVGTPTINYDEQLRQIKLREQQAEAARLEAERKEKNKAQGFFTGFEAMNPNQRQGMATTIRQKMQNNIPLTASEQGLVQNVPQFRSMVEAEMAKYPQSNTQVTAASQSQNVAPSPPPPPAAQNRRQRRTNANANTKQKTPVASDPTQQQVTTQQPAPVTEQPNVVQEEPMGIASIVPKRPDPYVMDPNVGKFTVTDLPVPKEKSIKDVLAERAEADRMAGVNTDIYKDMMKDLEGKRGKLAGRKQEAIGNALMQTGLALLGSRKGQEFAVLGESGQRSLQGLALANEKIRDTEDRIDDARRSLLVAENDYNRTRSDKAFDEVTKQRDKIEGLQIRNIEQKNLANQKNAEIQTLLEKSKVDLAGQGVQAFGYELNADTQRRVEQSRRSGSLAEAQLRAENSIIVQNLSNQGNIDVQKLRNQNDLAVERIRAFTANRQSETERAMSEYNNILKTQGIEKAEEYVRLRERMTGRVSGSDATLQEKYADDWLKMDPRQRSDMKKEGITTEREYIDHRLRLAGRAPTSGGGGGGGSLQQGPNGTLNYVPRQ